MTFEDCKIYNLYLLSRFWEYVIYPTDNVFGESMKKALEMQNLKKNYGETEAVKGVSFHIREGEIFALLGPNGAGKTSTISVITSLEKPSSGSVHIFGKDIGLESKTVKSLVGCVPQEVVSHGFFTVQEVLFFVSGYYGLKDNKKRIDALLERLGLWPHKDKKIPHLSGGLKRRFMIAKALVHAPKLLLLDEPTAGLDLELRSSLWQFVRQLNKEDGVSILLTTHYLEEAEHLCDQVGILDHGLLKKSGPIKDLIKELTLRRVVLKLSQPVGRLESPYLINQSDRQIVLKLPYSLGVGEVMEGLKMDSKNIFDIEVQEGDLEEVFINVVGGHQSV